MSELNKLIELLKSHIDRNIELKNDGFFVHYDEAKIILDKLTKTCEYKFDGNQVYKTGCSEQIYTSGFKLKECDFKYCTYCGGKIIEVKNEQD